MIYLVTKNRYVQSGAKFLLFHIQRGAKIFIVNPKEEGEEDCRYLCLPLYSEQEQCERWTVFASFLPLDLLSIFQPRSVPMVLADLKHTSGSLMVI